MVVRRVGEDVSAAAKSLGLATPPGNPKVKLLPHPKKVHPKDHPRDMSAVDLELRCLLRQLCQGRHKWPLYLHGDPGRGKTSATLALCDFAASALYLTCEDLTTDFLGARMYLAALGKFGLTVLDEVGGRDTITEAPYQAVKLYADTRINLPTIYVSNLLPENIGTVYDKRIASRILCGTWFHLHGSDRRMEP